MRDYETICDVTDSSGEEAIESMIEIASNDAEKSVLKSSYSSTQIVSEIENITTVQKTLILEHRFQKHLNGVYSFT